MNPNKDSRKKLIKTLGGYDGNTGPSEATKAEILSSCVDSSHQSTQISTDVGK